MAGALAFSQVIAFSGAGRELVAFAIGLSLNPLLIVLAMLVISLFLGMFINLLAIVMLTLPLFLPVVIALGFNPVWFAVMFLLTLEMGATSPPFGLSLFVMKGVAPKDTSMGDIYRAAIPFLALDSVVLILILVVPALALWLPNAMR